MNKFTGLDYYHLAKEVFKEDYPGYKPDVVESPNGDGKLDNQKQYAHIAMKYISPNRHINGVSLYSVLGKAHDMAIEKAVELGLPEEWFPSIKYSALRVLKYPPGATSAPHTDFSLFTLNLYRNNAVTFRYLDNIPDKYNFSDGHPGEILELLSNGRHKALEHEVGRSANWQYSLVYFAIPNHALKLPDGRTVGEYIDERINRSRY